LKRGISRPGLDLAQSEEAAMHVQIKAFKSIAAQVCRRRRFPFPEFMDDRGLETILIEAQDKNLSATEIAALVLWECCCTDGKFNNFIVGFLSVVQYLNEQEQDIGLQPYKDLASMMKVSTTKEAIDKWMETHFP
jgi:hypothetical protein